MNLQRSFLYTGAATVALGFLLFGISDRTETGFLLATAALLPAALAVIVTLDARHRSLSQTRLAVARLALVFQVAGIAWITGGHLTGSVLPSQRDGAILLATGGVLLILCLLDQDYQAWLLASTLAGASLGAALMIVPEAFRATPETWAIATLAALLGLTTLSYPVISAVARPHSTYDHGTQRIAVVGWIAFGAGYLLLSLSLGRLDRVAPLNFWLILLSAGALAIVADHATERSPGAQPAVRPLLSGPAWSGLLVTAIVAAGCAAWIARELERGSAWALLAFAAFMLAAILPAVVISSLLQRRNLSRLSAGVLTLLHLSRTDPLTGLLNRRGLDERLSTELQRAARFNHDLAIGIVDIDDFKSVNDEYGHPAGDAVLQRVAALLQRELRTIDVVGRFGGEEFLLILPETSLQGAWVAADRVLHAIRDMEPVEQAGGRVITVSIGLAGFPQHGRSQEALIQAADEALYAAKRSGKNQILAATTES